MEQEIKKLESAIEAILFAMGKRLQSARLRQQSNMIRIRPESCFII